MKKIIAMPKNKPAKQTSTDSTNGKPALCKNGQARTFDKDRLFCRFIIIRLLLLLLGISSFSVMANLNVYDFKDADKEKRFKVLINELRCPKCQNNNLADSNAPLATDIKNHVYQSVQKGDSDSEIVNFLVARYGEFITYRPRNTIIWFLPMGIGVLGLLVAVVVIRRKRREAQQNNTDNIPDMAAIIKQYQEEKPS